MERDSENDEDDAGDLRRGRDLGQHNDPVTVAVAGSSEIRRAYVTRGSLPMASWSQT